MTRKKRDYTREILPDPKYNDTTVARFINVVMESGKRSIAEKAIYGALDVLSEKTKESPVEAFHRALSQVRPVVEVRSRRVGGATYQVPSEVRPKRAEALALRWIKTAANDRTEKRLSDRLANEMLDALQNRGNAVKKREDTHRMAEANKAFAHFKW